MPYIRPKVFWQLHSLQTPTTLRRSLNFSGMCMQMTDSEEPQLSPLIFLTIHFARSSQRSKTKNCRIFRCISYTSSTPWPFQSIRVWVLMGHPETMIILWQGQLNANQQMGGIIPPYENRKTHLFNKPIKVLISHRLLWSARILALHGYLLRLCSALSAASFSIPYVQSKIESMWCNYFWRFFDLGEMK